MVDPVETGSPRIWQLMSDERWLVTGATGQLGHDLVAQLSDREVTALGRAELDITCVADVEEAVRQASVVVNAAAWTAVDEAEEHEDAAWQVNAQGAENVARACAKSGALLVHLSTDYVFSGDSHTPYSEAAETSPRSAYGRTKAAGEKAVLLHLPERSYVLRTAWLYGEHGTNFVRTVMSLEQQRDTIEVVVDQMGQPTWSNDLARRIVELVDRRPDGGIYHGTASGETTWFGLARAVFEEIGADPSRVLPTVSENFPRPAPRPTYSVLGHDRWRDAGMAPMRYWREALTQAVPSIARSMAS